MKSTDQDGPSVAESHFNAEYPTSRNNVIERVSHAYRAQWCIFGWQISFLYFCFFFNSVSVYGN